MRIRPSAEMPLSPRRSTLRRVVVLMLAALLAGLAAAYTGWWLAAAGRLRDGALSWIEQRRDEGIRLDVGTPTRAGFPFSIGVDFPDAIGALPRADWSWRSQAVRVSAPVIGERVLTVALLGEQILALPPEAAGGPSRRLSGDVEHLAFVFDPADDGVLGQLIARRLTLADAAGDKFGVGSLDVVVSRPTAEESGSTGGMMLTANDVRLPAAAQTPLGRTVARVELKTRLIGALGGTVVGSALVAWRDQGGIVEIDRLDCDYGPISLEADGTLALDRRGQPIGALSTRIHGWQAGLDSLAAAKAMPPYTVAAAKILLRGLTRPNGQNGSILEAPLSLQDQTLTLGPVPLLHVPEVQWLDPRSR